MTGKGWVLGLLAALTCAMQAQAGVSGRVEGCGAYQACTLRLRLNPDDMSRAGPVTVFVGIMQTNNGEPNPSVAGWYDGHGWVVGAPKAAWTGRVTTMHDTAIRLDGGVCGLVARAGGQPGTYAVYAGWGSQNVASLEGGINPAEMQAAMRDATPEVAAKYAQLLAEYKQAQTRLAQYGDSPAVAFSSMRSAGAFGRIQTFDCGG